MNESRNRDDLVLACNLAALDQAQRKRRAQLAEWLQEGTVDIVEGQTGYSFRLDPSSLAARHIDELVTLERKCCPFLKLHVRPGSGDRGPVLEVGGGEKVKSFIASQFGIRGVTGDAD